MKQVKWWLFIILMVVLTIIGIAIAQVIGKGLGGILVPSPVQTQQTPAPVSESTPSKTSQETTAEELRRLIAEGRLSVLPAHFTTYADESGLFRISYPQDWRLALSKIEGLTQDVEDYMKGIGSEGSLAGGKVVFFAGVPYSTGHNPNVTVVVTPAGEGEWKLEDFVEAVVQRGYMKDAEEYHEFSRTKVVVDGREAIILDCEAKYPLVTDELRVLTMYLRDNKLMWAVTCGVLSPKSFSGFESDLHAIVRSLRILK